ncbi:MAG: hypothetical protein M1393_00885 [Candidatus Thermoplasmatota archaeon]|nr:hypothetical protein [Candidatus Thermoplasmatota archaeon]MDA8144204.1 hypothetical protein [Thermoplasmatales archaeon]
MAERNILKFFLTSRISFGQFIFLGLFYAFLLFMGLAIALFHPGGILLPALGKEILFSTLFAITVIMSGGMGSMIFIKADRDFLFNYGVSSKDMTMAVFWTSGLYIGLFMCFTFGFTPLLTGYGNSPEWLYYLDVPFFLLMFPSLTVISLSWKKRHSWALILLLTVFSFSAIIGNPYSIGSIISGSPYVSSAITISISLLVFLAATHSFDKVSYGRFRYQGSGGSREVRKMIDFSGKKGIRAIYHFNLSETHGISVARLRRGKIDNSGRLPTSLFFAISTVISIFIVVERTVFSGFPTLVFVYPAIYPTIYLFVIVELLLSLSIANERLWVSFNSMPPHISSRHYLISRSLVPWIVFLPLMLSASYLYMAQHLLIFQFFFNLFLFGYIILFPFTVIMVYVSALTFPVQMKDDFNSNELSISTLILMLPFSVFIITGIIAAFAPLFFIISIIAWYLAGIIILAPKRIISRIFSSMSERGFS